MSAISNKLIWIGLFALQLAFFGAQAKTIEPTDGLGLPASKIRVSCEKALLRRGLIRSPVQAEIRANEDISINNWLMQIPDSPKSDVYTSMFRTQRGFTLMLEERVFPSDVLNLETLQGRQVLDLACGDGILVEELRRAGINARGLDIYLDAYQLSKRYFAQARAEDTGLPANSLDVVISSQGPLTHRFGDPVYARALVAEIARILKPGGLALLSPIGNVDDPLEVDPIKRFKSTALDPWPAEFEIVRTADLDWMHRPSYLTDMRYGHYFMVLRKKAKDF